MPRRPLTIHERLQKLAGSVPVGRIHTYEHAMETGKVSYHLVPHRSWYMARATEVFGLCGKGWGYDIHHVEVIGIKKTVMVQVTGEVWACYDGATLRTPAAGACVIPEETGHFDPGRFALEDMIVYGLESMGFAGDIPSQVLANESDLTVGELMRMGAQGLIEQHSNRGLSKDHLNLAKDMEMEVGYVRLVGERMANVTADSRWFRHQANRIFGVQGTGWGFQVSQCEFSERKPVIMTRGHVWVQLEGSEAIQIPALSVRRVGDPSSEPLNMLPGHQITAAMNNALRNMGFGHNRETYSRHPEAQMAVAAPFRAQNVEPSTPVGAVDDAWPEGFDHRDEHSWIAHPHITQRFPKLSGAQRKIATAVIRRILRVTESSDRDAILRMLLEALANEMGAGAAA